MLLALMTQIVGFNCQFIFQISYPYFNDDIVFITQVGNMNLDNIFEKQVVGYRGTFTDYDMNGGRPIGWVLNNPNNYECESKMGRIPAIYAHVTIATFYDEVENAVIMPNIGIHSIHLTFQYNDLRFRIYEDRSMENGDYYPANLITGNKDILSMFYEVLNDIRNDITAILRKFGHKVYTSENKQLTITVPIPSYNHTVGRTGKYKYERNDDCENDKCFIGSWSSACYLTCDDDVSVYECKSNTSTNIGVIIGPSWSSDFTLKVQDGYLIPFSSDWSFTKTCRDIISNWAENWIEATCLDYFDNWTRSRLDHKSTYCVYNHNGYLISC